MNETLDVHPWPDNSGGWMNFTGVNGVCRDAASTHYGWVNSHMHGSQVSVVTLCQQYMETWFLMWQEGMTMTQEAGNTFNTNAAHINGYSGKAIGMALTHEFAHAPPIFGATHTLDQKCTLPNGNVVAGSGWFCITQFGEIDTA